MRAVIALLLFSLGASGASNNNTIIALVNENVITFKSIENQLIDTNSLDEKLEIIDSQIEFILQIEKANQLGINPSQNDILEVLTQVANNNNITLEQLKSYPEFPSLRLEILNRLTILKLQQIITKDIKFNLTDDEVNLNCINTINKKNIKQIRVAQIIISQIEKLDKTNNNQEKAVRNFLLKLSNHITKGASFDVFAKLHSQHPSYANGGLSDWLLVDNPTIEMFDSLQEGEVSSIYANKAGWAIAIKVDERYVDPNLEKCKEKIIYKKTQKFYFDWLKDLRDSAYIEIYTDKL
ncbi:MAG: peptidylprolyl isomerase [Candidatus Thioglobus autotrophicus]|nr:peptidylprolyl isomerase [Candidatus Thioglobus autotrophicus]